jgi:Dullard-like phosphatase family protein
MNEKMKLFQRTQNVLGIKGEIMPYEQRSNLKNYIKKSQKVNTVKRKLNFEKTYIKEYDYMTNLISEDNEKENNNINNYQNNSMINIKSKNHLNLKEKKIESCKLKKNDIVKKLLILELDETLIHTSFVQVPNCDYDYKFNINFLERPVTVFVYKRPYLNEFLYQMSKYYNIIIYSSNVPEYSNPLIDKLDEEKVIYKRIYKDKKIELNGKLISDLTKLIYEYGKNIIIISNNSLHSFINDSNNNTLPINSWNFKKSDDELIKLKSFLEFLSSVNDVRDYIKGIAVKNIIDYERIENLMNTIRLNRKQKNKFYQYYNENDDRYVRNPSKEFNCSKIRRNQINNCFINSQRSNSSFIRNNHNDNINNNYLIKNRNLYNKIKLTLSTKKRIEEKILSKLKPNFYQNHNINYQNDEKPIQETPKFSNIYKKEHY